jgi:GT2 family glycosyltransferase
MSLPLIIVPVFNAFEFLEPCLQSIDRTVPDATRVLLIDDASTDHRVRPFLETWRNSTSTHCQLLVHERNQGFVASVNHGMRLAESDVVLLNSDTELSRGSLKRMQTCLQSNRSIATVTPWSNNGEIVSIPNFCASNPLPPDPDAVADAIASCGSPIYPEMPTAVGFCMAISGVAIGKLGLFDEQTFGKGYGEENDFCQRAEKVGMLNVLCDDAYVLHHGGASFSPLGLKPDEKSMQRLLDKHPDYQQKVSEFISNDPLAARRQDILACIERAGVRMR